MIKTLEGIKIVDLTLAAAGPACTKLLAEFGAECWLVEPVGGVVNRPMMQFDYNNANKKSIPLNLKTEEGKEIIHRLLSKADVFVSNYRTKGLAKMGLDYETLHKLYPGLVYATITGYGEEGPMKDAAGFDTTGFWGMTGMMHDMQEKDAMPPVIPSGIGDQVTGTVLALGIASALVRRNKTGEGMKVATSLLANGLYFNYSQQYYYQTGVKYPKSRLKPNRALQNTYPCKDGYFILTTLSWEKDFWNILRVIGRDDLVGDPRWTCMADTENAKAPELREILDEGFSKMTLAEVREAFAKYDLAFAPIDSSADAIQNPQVIANNFFFEYTKADGRKFTVPVTPLRMGDNENPEFTPGPALGLDTEAILKDCGYTAEEIQAFYDKKITFQA